MPAATGPTKSSRGALPGKESAGGKHSEKVVGELQTRVPGTQTRIAGMVLGMVRVVVRVRVVESVVVFDDDDDVDEDGEKDDVA